MVRSEGATCNVQLFERHGTYLVSLGGVSVKHLPETHTVATQYNVMATVVGVHREEVSEIIKTKLKQISSPLKSFSPEFVGQFLGLAHITREQLVIGQ